MASLAAVKAKCSSQIDQATARFRDHEGMNRKRVSNWLAQFSERDLTLANKILSQVQYIDAASIRSMTAELVQMILSDAEGVDPSRIVFVPLSPAPGGGAQIVARVLRRITVPLAPRVSDMVDVQRMAPGDVDVLVFIDDFSGTGDTLADWWDNVEAIVRPLAARIVFGALVMTGPARTRAEQFATVTVVEQIGPASNVLSDDNKAFAQAEKARILLYCRRTRCSPSFLRGFGNCGLLLAFKHACPNNSLPILWYDARGWNTLFLRSAI
jgi:hypothetical protein